MIRRGIKIVEMTQMMSIMRDLTPLSRAVCSEGYDTAVEYLRRELPFRVISVPDTFDHNGWVIPPSWDVKEAWISKNGSKVYDGTAHPIAVIAQSRSFSGTINLDELRRHLHYDHRRNDSIPFHYRQFFKVGNATGDFVFRGNSSIVLLLATTKSASAPGKRLAH